MLFPPAVVTCADELLVDAQRLLDDETHALYADAEPKISCGPDCHMCCEHAVVVTPAELRAIRRAVGELPTAIQARIAARADAIRDRLRTAKLSPESELSPPDRAFAERYFGLREPCPLLIDGICAVRDVRPLACRDYVVSSPPRHCAEPAGEQFVRIVRRRPIDRNFARVSAAFGESQRRLLALALDESTPLPEPSRRSGPKMAKMLLSSW